MYHWGGNWLSRGASGNSCGHTFVWLSLHPEDMARFTYKPRCDCRLDSHLEISPHHWTSILRCSFHQEVSIKAIPVQRIIIYPPHQTCLSYRIMMSSSLAFFSTIFKKKLRELILHLCQKFPSAFSVSPLLFMDFLITVFSNFLFPSKLFINSFWFVLSHSRVNFSFFWRPVLFLDLLIHCTH